jgi:hypothetical protein
MTADGVICTTQERKEMMCSPLSPFVTQQGRERSIPDVGGTDGLRLLQERAQSPEQKGWSL